MLNSEIENHDTRMEPPYHKRSPLWQHRETIRAGLELGYSYRQILERLELDLTPSRLATFCREELGITSRQFSRPKTRVCRTEADIYEALKGLEGG